ncbi:hypothetical protein M8818_006341 [Zalaria obscura]|uniref:Uncharacterized protein n=1 Tax=Zalaria obscura TaxID=2024903 RepID=A0ACC3S6K8_9PEZI
MKSFIIASAALVATVAADSIGSAIVVNKCSYPIHLANVPSADGGYSEIDKVLDSQDKYTQEWTELSNGNGWSIKISNSSSFNDILQYEYTYQEDATIWYDLSEVNGNPWDGDWEITSNTDSCTPKQQAYRYATDDAYGMQSCDATASITVTICSGDESNDAAAASASSSVEAQSSTATSSASSSSTEAPSSTSEAASTTSTSEAQSTTESPSASSTASNVATTLMTSVLTTTPAYGSTVIVTETEVATATVTSWHYQHTHSWGARDAKRAHPRHVHGHEQHA